MRKQTDLSVPDRKMSTQKEKFRRKILNFSSFLSKIGEERAKDPQNRQYTPSAATKPCGSPVRDGSLEVCCEVIVVCRKPRK